MATRPKNVHVGGEQLPLITPPSNWQPPTELPDLRRCPVVALDRETKDEGLINGRGPGWAYAVGHVAGTSLAWRQGSEVHSIYVSLRHPDSQNFDPAQLARWEQDHIRAGVRFAYQNAPYDIGWGHTDLGVPPPTAIDDVGAMMVMLDEHRRGKYDLNGIAEWCGVPGKDERALREAAAAYGYHGEQVKENLWRMAARYVAPYAQADAASTLLCREHMLPKLDAEGSRAAYELEMDLVPMVHEMRRRGVRVDVDAAYERKLGLLRRRDEELVKVAELVGRSGLEMEDVRRPGNLRTWCDHFKISYPFTAPTRAHPDGQPSFAKWMRKYDKHPLPRLVARADQLDEAANKFIQGFIIDYAHHGRLHANINQFLSEEGGTKTHRFSYSDPALQQMPNRDEEMAELIRGVFLPEEGELWLRPDYSQQEYRLIVHFAALLRCRRAEEAVQMYVDNPDTDFHNLVVEWTGLRRKEAKDANFAKAYRAGIKKFASMINKTEREAAEIYARYDAELPFVAEAAKELQRLAETRGYVRLLDGARLHYERWEPSWREEGEPYEVPISLTEAWLRWPGRRLKRAFAYQAFNGLIQGSAARMTKSAMRDCWRAGHVPLLQLHDELDFSVREEAQGKEIVELMRNTVKLRVPVKVDAAYGRTWASAKLDFGAATAQAA